MLSAELTEKITKALYLEIPEFEKYASGYLDEEFITGYLVLDCFGSFVKDLTRKDYSSEIVRKCYSFVNQLCEANDKDIEEWLSVTFLESLVEKGKPIEISRLELNGKALMLFEEVINGPMFGDGIYL